MKFLSALLVAGFASTSLAAPYPSNAKFVLKVTSDDPRVNGKCISTYHTGAGLADAVVINCGPDPLSKLFKFSSANNKIQYLGYGSDVPSALSADPGAYLYDSWGDVVINAGNEGTAFTYDAKKGFLQKSNGMGFIACRWSHRGAFQLFGLGDAKPQFPASCARVKLVKGC